MCVYLIYICFKVGSVPIFINIIVLPIVIAKSINQLEIAYPVILL